MKKTGNEYKKPFAKEIFGVENTGYYPYPREELIKQPIFPYFVLDGGAFNLMNDRFGTTDGDEILELTLSGKLFEIFRYKGEFNWETSFTYVKDTDFTKKYEWQIWPQRLYFTIPVAHKFLQTGDRKYADEGAIIGGIGMLGDLPATFIGIERGRNLEERIKCNFGCPMPEGYRKALRLMKQAEKFQRPIICFVDTSGAFCGEEAEERGQGQAIADNLMQMMALETPVITIVIGEGGSGGALGLSVANKLYMLENAVFSVISPEGCASILWEDAKLAPDAAEALHITAEDMVRFGVAEEIIKEEIQSDDVSGKIMRYIVDTKELRFAKEQTINEERIKEMEEYLRCQNPAKVKKVFIVHGDYEAQLPYSEVLKKAGFKDIVIPEPGEVCQLGVRN